MSSEPAPVERVRVSTEEKHNAEKILSVCLAEGRLDVNEFDQRVAALWQATYRDEVQWQCFRELNVPASQWQEVPAPKVSPLPPGVGSSYSVAFFSGTTRKGVWSLTPVHSAFSIFGGCELDLRAASFGDTVTINAYAVFGGIEVIVPDNAMVVTDGMGIFGGFDDHSQQPLQVGGPTIYVRGLALFGGVTVKRMPG